MSASDMARRLMLKHSLAGDIVVVVAIKMIVIIAAAVFVFGPGQRPKLDAGTIETRLIGAAATSSQTRNP
jgi:hypothetical protein